MLARRGDGQRRDRARLRCQTADVTLGVTVTGATGPTARLGRWAPAAFGIGVVLTVGIVIVARSVDGGRPGWIVGGLLILAWLAAGLSLLRRACPLGRLALVAAGGASIASPGSRRPAPPPSRTTRRLLADFAAAFGLAMLPAVGLPPAAGAARRVAGTPDARWLAIIGYGTSIVGVLDLVLGSRTGGGWAVLLAAVLAVSRPRPGQPALPGGHGRDQAAAAVDRLRGGRRRRGRARRGRACSCSSAGRTTFGARRRGRRRSPIPLA